LAQKVNFIFNLARSVYDEATKTINVIE